MGDVEGEETVMHRDFGDMSSDDVAKAIAFLDRGKELAELLYNALGTYVDAEHLPIGTVMYAVCEFTGRVVAWASADMTSRAQVAEGLEVFLTELQESVWHYLDQSSREDGGEGDGT
jgi:hypothetical protein